MGTPDAALRPRQKLGKYRIRRKIDKGPYAAVYEALDTVEGARVALKVPHAHLLTPSVLDDFYREVRLTARLDHPNILPLKNADFVGERFVIAFPLGQESLADRLGRRLSRAQAGNFADQALAAVAHAHQHGVIHCDLKPENFILFPGGRLRLTDFGIAKLARRTVRASGSGTVGYIAPEQAMGRPSQRSDVFALGLVLFRIFSGKLPEWPFAWPPPGIERVRRALPGPGVAVLRRALEVEPRRRFADAGQMHRAFRDGAAAASDPRPSTDDKARWAAFRRVYGSVLGARHRCASCGGPVSEAMRHCPWCAGERPRHAGQTAFPARCPRCRRGVKLDWRFCPWCWGAAVGPRRGGAYSDVRYGGRCAAPGCPRRDLMPFMRYCPWCHAKAERRWKLPGTRSACSRCGWGVAPGLWRACAWCGRRLPEGSR